MSPQGDAAVLPAGIAGGREGLARMGWVGGGVRLVAVPKWLLCLVLLGRMSRPIARLPVLVVGPGAMLPKTFCSTLVE